MRQRRIDLLTLTYCWVGITLNVAVIATIAVFAPIENKNKPLTDRLKHINKVRGTLMAVLYTCISTYFLVNEWRVGAMITATMVTVAVLMVIVEKWEFV